MLKYALHTIAIQFIGTQRRERVEMDSKSKLALLILSVFLSSLLPINISADSGNTDKGNGIPLVSIKQGSGYFSTEPIEQVPTQVNAYEYKSETLPMQSIENLIGSSPINTAVVLGDSVVVSTLDGDIIATPHTLTTSGWVDVRYQIKTFEGPVEISFGFNGVDQVQMVKGESFETYNATKYRSVETIQTKEFKPEVVISVKTNLSMPTKADTDISLNSKYVEITCIQHSGSESIQVVNKLAYDTYDSKTGIYSYKEYGLINEPYLETVTDWKPSTDAVRVEIKSLQGSNRWDTLAQTPIVKNTWYSTRFWVDIPFKGMDTVSGKYNIAIKPVGADLLSAIILDPWYNSSWLYRKSITVTTPSSGYQTKIIVGYNSTAVGEDVDCNSHCNTTFADLRFTAADGSTLLHYWTESSNTTSPYYAATVWVENGEVPSSTIYMYYGNNGAASASDGDNTFQFFDGFTTAWNVPVKWEGDIASGSVAGGILTFRVAALAHDYLLSVYGASSTTAAMRVRANVTASSVHGDYSAIVFGNDTQAATLTFDHSGTHFSECTKNGWTNWTFTNNGFSANAYYIYDLQVVSNTTFYYYQNGTGGFIDNGYNTVPAYNPLCAEFDLGDHDSVREVYMIDWVLIRKLSATPQTFGGYGSEATESDEVITLAATSVEEDTATTGGNITYSMSNVTAWGIQYGDNPAYGSWANTTSNPGVPYAYSKNLTSLTKGQLYYFRAFVQSTATIGYGSQLTFLTKPDPPTLLSTSAYNTTAVQLTWTVGTGADITYIRYSNVSYPATVGSGTWGANVTAPTATVIIGGLTSLQTYYFSVWSISTGGGLEQASDTYVCGSQQVAGAPTVTTNAVSGYGNDWATASGTQTGGYPASTLFGFQYGSTVAYGSWANTTTTVTGGLFTATISGLTSSATYHYRAFALNAYGIGYGADMTFATAGTAVLYENYLYGCNTTWSQSYESTSANVTSNYTATQVFGNNWTAQTFTTTQSHSVHQVVLWASRSATAAAGYMYVSIREANTDNVTSPDMAIGLYAISLVSTTGGPIEVSLDNEIQLDTTKKYAIVVRAPAADATNYISLWSSNTSGTSIYAGGNAIRSVNGGGTWTSYTGYDVYFSIIGRPQPIYGNVQAAQSFTVSTSPHTATKVRLILGRVGQPGNIYVSIRNYTGGVISNADLALVTLNGNAITLDKASYDCVLVPEKSLEANKQYAIVITAPSGDRYNYILMCADAGAGYAGGTALMSIDSGISWIVQTFDYNFEIWGNACLNVLNTKVFKNYLVTGDWLIVSETLNVSPPYYDNNQDPSTLFVLSFMGLTGTTYASTPCELWEKGPIVIYLNPTQASALTWGGNYKVRLTDLAGTTFSEYALLSTDWSASSLIYLDNWVRLVAKDMEAYKTAKTGATVTYLTYVADKGYVLNQDGGAIFNQACPRLSYVRPNIFQITSNTPDISTTSVPMPGATIDYRVRLGSYISGLLDQLAGAMGVDDVKTAGGILMVAIYFLVAFGTVMKGFAWAGMIAAFPIILMGMYFGLLDVTMIIIILVILAFLFVREFFFKGG
jgi:hypothetical protein